MTPIHITKHNKNYLVGLNYVNWNDSSNAIGLSFLADGATTPLTNPPLPTLTQNMMDTYFSKIQGIDFVRLWISYEHEGLLFDNNCNLIGIDEKYWLPNIIKILDTANKYGVKMYLCLVEAANTGVFNQGDDKKYRTNQIKIMQSFVKNPNIYTKIVINPLITAIGNHPGLFAIDIVNEPENTQESDNSKYFTEGDWDNFVNLIYQAIKDINPYVKVSAGCLNRDTAIKWSKFLDFADIHYYTDKDLISYGKSIPYYNAKDFNGKKCLVGECGLAHDNENAPNSMANQYEVQTNINLVINLIKSWGYWGTAPWGLYSDKGFIQSDAHSDEILKGLKNIN